MSFKILLIGLGIIYLIGSFISYGIHLAYFNYVLFKYKEEKNEDANIEAMAFSLSLLSIVSILALITTSHFKWCGIKFRRNKIERNI